MTRAGTERQTMFACTDPAILADRARRCADPIIANHLAALAGLHAADAPEPLDCPFEPDSGLAKQWHWYRDLVIANRAKAAQGRLL